MIRKLSRNHGMTLVETMVAITVASFIFGALAYLTWMSSRNLMNLHVQTQSQQSASAALERVCTMFRSSAQFQRFAGDTDATVTRIRVQMPAQHNGPSQWGVVAFNPDRKQVVFWADEDDATFDGSDKPEYDSDGDGMDGDSDDPTMMFRAIHNFQMVYRTEFWLTLVAGFDYAGFALYPNPEGLQSGIFQTDVRARNFNAFVP